jgi:hypothetical protein
VSTIFSSSDWYKILQKSVFMEVVLFHADRWTGEHDEEKKLCDIVSLRMHLKQNVLAL